MKKPTLRDVLIALARRDPALVRSDGEINHNAIARATGAHQPTITRILSGESKEPKTSSIDALCRYFRVTPAQIRGEHEIPDLFPPGRYTFNSAHLAAPPFTVAASGHSGETAYPVPLFNATGSMGDGVPVPDAEVILGHLTLAAEWIKETLPKVAPRNLCFIIGKGPSMEPTFSDGDILLVDTGIKVVNVDAIYVLSGHGRLFVKRVRQKLDGAFEVSSDNPSVKTSDTLNGDYEIVVHGRVVWAWNGKRI